VLRAPVVLDRAQPFQLFDESGTSYIDLCSGGYGHSNIGVHAALIEHLSRARIIQSCDRTSVKRRFVEEFAARILGPRRMQYACCSLIRPRERRLKLRPGYRTPVQ
jgi:4-aminobutyrate aminotransferase-like enzyme